MKIFKCILFLLFIGLHAYAANVGPGFVQDERDWKSCFTRTYKASLHRWITELYCQGGDEENYSLLGIIGMSHPDISWSKTSTTSVSLDDINMLDDYSIEFRDYMDRVHKTMQRRPTGFYPFVKRRCRAGKGYRNVQDGQVEFSVPNHYASRIRNNYSLFSAKERDCKHDRKI